MLTGPTAGGNLHRAFKTARAESARSINPKSFPLRIRPLLLSLLPSSVLFCPSLVGASVRTIPAAQKGREVFQPSRWPEALSAESFSAAGTSLQRFHLSVISHCAVPREIRIREKKTSCMGLAGQLLVKVGIFIAAPEPHVWA